MKNLIKSVVVGLAGAALTAGCSTVAISSDGAMNKGERLLTLQSDGYAIADLIPIGSGIVTVDKDGQPHERFVMFSDRTHTDRLYAAAQLIAERQNCELTNVFFTNGYRGVDFQNCYGLLTVYDVSLSAVLKQK